MIDEDKIRITIAEFCGWTEIIRKNSGSYGGLQGIKPGNDYSSVVPSYLRDLNAIHEAVKCASKNKDWCWAEYLMNLNVALDRNFYDADEHRVVEATAEQRAGAFIKTIKK